ncbi:hypothetical protein [Noviherbaspirillum sp.]|uniref:hypothetical protein n=1 Tax=Noviherbaspirillum sp. TaxID=1926288 RepID=UPI002D2A65F9|nr:hypothetical protein [Noviherbaspirillum sp.]HZW22275.1 hypothetical protein [Noviherbaspirillum sp.]
MSVLSLAFPAEAFAANAMAVARPLLGLGVLAALMVVFKPLLVGMLRAALLVVKPRKSLEERSQRSMMQSVLMLNRMARDLDRVEPSLANELRSIASRQ